MPSEEENRRCCILGGCGCGPGGNRQLRALADVIEEAGSPERAAKVILEIFGAGPHHDRLRALGLPAAETA